MFVKLENLPKTTWKTTDERARIQRSFHEDPRFCLFMFWTERAQYWVSGRLLSSDFRLEKKSDLDSLSTQVKTKFRETLEFGIFRPFWLVWSSLWCNQEKKENGKMATAITFLQITSFGWYHHTVGKTIRFLRHWLKEQKNRFVSIILPMKSWSKGDSSQNQLSILKGNFGGSISLTNSCAKMNQFSNAKLNQLLS